jgi:hypothetical protein
VWALMVSCSQGPWDFSALRPCAAHLDAVGREKVAQGRLSKAEGNVFDVEAGLKTAAVRHEHRSFLCKRCDAKRQRRWRGSGWHSGEFLTLCVGHLLGWKEAETKRESEIVLQKKVISLFLVAVTDLLFFKPLALLGW